MNESIRLIHDAVTSVMQVECDTTIKLKALDTLAAMLDTASTYIPDNGDDNGSGAEEDVPKVQKPTDITLVSPRVIGGTGEAAKATGMLPRPKEEQ